MSDYKFSVPKDVIGSGLENLMEINPRIVVLSSDVSVSTNIELIRKKYPDRFYELGIAEQNTMSIAGGLASEGFIPVYVALAIFSCEMTFAQMRQICNSNLNVKIIGTHPGVDDGEDGSGHHANEDLAITRSLPRMNVFLPSDSDEVISALRTMVSIDGPAYMRASRAGQPEIHSPECEFPVGKVEVLRDTGNQFAIVFEGSSLQQALSGWIELESSGVHGKLVSLRTLKPIDKKFLIALAKTTDVIITVENHSVIGGVYGAIAELIATVKHKALLVPVGFDDIFAESGSEKDIKEKYGLSASNITEKYFCANKYLQEG